MKQAIYIHTNAYDTVLLQNGTHALVGRDVKFHDFLDAGPEDRDEWNGSALWDDFAKTIGEAADILVSEGAKLLAYYENDALVIADEKRWQERCEFYRI